MESFLNGASGIIFLCFVVFLVSIIWSIGKVLLIRSRMKVQNYSKDIYEDNLNNRKKYKYETKHIEKDINNEKLQQLINHFDEKANMYKEQNDEKKAEIMIAKRDLYQKKLDKKLGTTGSSYANTSKIHDGNEQNIFLENDNEMTTEQLDSLMKNVVNSTYKNKKINNEILSRARKSNKMKIDEEDSPIKYE